MRLVVFNSRDSKYKCPVGAVRRGTVVTFNLPISKEFDIVGVALDVIRDRDEEKISVPMRLVESVNDIDPYNIWSCQMEMDEIGLYWYTFRIETPDGWHFVNRGEDNRALLTDAEPSRWQQTVYERVYEAPSWIEGGIFYHIFVDRFARSGERVKLPGKVLRNDWGGQPVYLPDANGKVWNNDFFGGNLRGIIEKLDYLDDLGVTCLYLSPIFEAYSNHKYDTGDYMKIDPMFGTEDDFRELCDKAKERGIAVILDGVFAHTGSDSIYFNRDGHYDSYGAYGHPDSPYRDWYHFGPNESYDAWWGIETLPKVNKRNRDYQKFICGENGVARKWLREGAAGWRFDVVDELPNEFVDLLCSAVKAEKPEAMLLGEVWEDASNKIAYDQRKNYFQGNRLDSVMNYPFKNAIIEYVRYGNASWLAETVERVMENYPPEVVNCLMNNLGTHDTPRILTALGGRYLGDHPNREEQAHVHMSEKERARATRLLMIASGIQMTLPGVPCIYYGDEAGMEGYADPFNRGCFPWGNEDQEILKWYRRIISFRRDHSVYRNGKYQVVEARSGLYAFVRYNDHERIMTVTNCGEDDERMALDGRWFNVLDKEYYEGTFTIQPGNGMVLIKR